MVASKITDDELKQELIKQANGDTTYADISKRYGVAERNLYVRAKRLRDSGFDPKNERYYNNPSNQVVGGYSTLYKYDTPEGRILEWVKTNRRLVDQLDDAKTVLKAMSSELPIIKTIPVAKKKYDKDKFTVLPLGDPHIGLLTWSKEVGEDWDVKIAKRVFEKVFKRLLERCPDTHEAVLVNTGDFFHSDNIKNMTSASGHILDVDGRHAKWLDAGVIIMRMFIEACLAKYNKVTFVNVPGNHDDILGAAIGIFCDHIYEKQNRLTVMRGESPFQYIHRGDVLLGFAHGHKCRLPALPGKMADDQYKLWGKSIHRHWITGHVHHNQWLQYKEHPGCTVESVGIIPPKDAYAFGGGYGAKRTTQAIVFDKKFGEFERYQEIVRKSD